MSKRIVKNSKELKKAVADKILKIIVVGSLAKKVDKAYKIKELSRIKMILLSSLGVGVGVAIVTAILTGKIKMLASTPVMASIATLIGIEILTLIAVAFMAISLILLLSKDYKKSKIKVNKNGQFEVKLERI